MHLKRVQNLLAYCVSTSIILVNSVLANWDGDKKETNDSFISRLGALVGVSEDIGSMQNPSADLQARTMNSITVEAMPGYFLGNWLLGPDFNYLWEGQLSSLQNAGGTNLGGSGWTLGVGARYKPAQRWSIQASFNFIGNYHFRRNTYAVEDDGLSGPLGIRIKGQYFLVDYLPLSVDFKIEYIRFGTLRVLSSDYAATTNSLMVGIGLSWHFGHYLKSDTSEDHSSSPGESLKKSDEIEIAVNPNHEEKAEQHLKEVIIQFGPYDTRVNQKNYHLMRKLVRAFFQDQNQRIKVDGHADTSGNDHRNTTLSLERAEHVRMALVALGIPSDRIISKGFGSSHPREDNETAAGRSANRRTEISFESEKSFLNRE